MRFQSDCYRLHDPRWSFAPLSGEGAAKHGGRFNPVGVSALYLASSIEGALAEAAQGFARKLEPLTLCLYEVDCEDILDLRKSAERKIENAELDAMACEWRKDRSEGREPPSWALARTFIAQGCSGILVPSFAAAARAEWFNLVLWRWESTLPYRVSLHDPGGRLPRDQRSWTG